jgi:hypothetical protein
MRVFATLLFSTALGIAMAGTAGADARGCSPNKACTPKEAPELKSKSLRDMTAPSDDAGWKQRGIAINPWIVPTFR